MHVVTSNCSNTDYGHDNPTINVSIHSLAHLGISLQVFFPHSNYSKSSAANCLCIRLHTTICYLGAVAKPL